MQILPFPKKLVNANSEVSVKSKVLGPSNQTAFQKLFGKVLLQMFTLLSHCYGEVPCQGLVIYLFI